MNEPKLEIIKKKYRGETTILSVRIPKDMIKDLDEIAAETGYSRNELIVKSMEFSIRNMKIIIPEEEMF